MRRCCLFRSLCIVFCYTNDELELKIPLLQTFGEAEGYGECTWDGNCDNEEVSEAKDRSRVSS